MDNYRIIEGSNCGQKLRIPSNKTFKAKCPICKSPFQVNAPNKKSSFIEDLYKENSPERIKQLQLEESLKYAESLASSTCFEIMNWIRIYFNKHLLEGYITNYCLDGDNIGFQKELIRVRKGLSVEKKEYTYDPYIHFKTKMEADVFTEYVTKRLREAGINDIILRQEKITVESFNPNTFFKAKTKEYDAYVIYIRITW